jgi:tripartite-type tricarboxylate transporter receptor subunit TctC
MRHVANRPRVPRTLAAAAIALAVAPTAHAQSVEQFFARKTITISIGYTAGGSYDLYGRMVARHLGKHIPGQPTVVAQNMPGAGSLKAANYIYEVAPKDGTALGVVVETAALEQALANPAALYDAAKFTWVGRVATSNNIFMQWHTAKVQSIDDSKRLESSLAGTGPGSIAETVPRLLNALAGTRFKLVSGYPASNEAMLAMERGEVDGASSSWAAVSVGKKEWLRENKIRIILQTAPERTAELPDAPALPELGTTPQDKQVYQLYASGSAIGRSVIAPPGLPADRAQALRSAFEAMVRDADFIADIQKTNVELDPLPGERVQELIVRTPNWLSGGSRCIRRQRRPVTPSSPIQRATAADVNPVLADRDQWAGTMHRQWRVP